MTPRCLQCGKVHRCTEYATVPRVVEALKELIAATDANASADLKAFVTAILLYPEVRAEWEKTK